MSLYRVAALSPLAPQLSISLLVLLCDLFLPVVQSQAVQGHDTSDAWLCLSSYTMTNNHGHSSHKIIKRYCEITAPPSRLLIEVGVSQCSSTTTATVNRRLIAIHCTTTVHYKDGKSKFLRVPLDKNRSFRRHSSQPISRLGTETEQAQQNYLTRQNQSDLSLHRNTQTFKLNL